MGIISGSFTGATQSSFGVDVEWSAETVVEQNLSRVTVRVYRRYYSIDVGVRPCTCTINGVTQTQSIPGVQHYSSNVREHIATFYQDVPHNSDGTMPACEIYADFYFNLTTSKEIYIGYMGAGGTVALETIPRASAFTYVMPNVTLGNVCLFKWVPASAAFRYRLQYAMGDLDMWTGAIHPNTTGEYTHTDALDFNSFATRITGNPPNGTVYVTLHTYSDSAGTVEVGSSAGSFTVTVPESGDTKPVVAISTSPCGSPIEGLYIQGKSGVSVGFDTVACKFGAWAADLAITVNGAAYPMDGSAMLTGGNVTVRGIVTDSRGFTGYDEKTIYVYPYRRPRAAISTCERCRVKQTQEEDGTIVYEQAEDGTPLYEPADDGTVLHLVAARDFEALDGSNSCTLYYNINGTGWVGIEAGDYISENTAELYLEGLEASKSYTVQVYAADSLDASDSTGVLVPTADVDFHLRHGGGGAAFGSYAQEAGLLDVWWRTKFRGAAVVEAGINYVDVRRLQFADNAAVYVPAPGRGIGLVAVMGNWNGWCLYVVGCYKDEGGSIDVLERIAGTLELTFAINNGSLEITCPYATHPWAYGWYIRNLHGN